MLWQHGTYEVLSNGSITTNPTVFEGDGRIQTQNACSAISSNIFYYNQPGMYKTWAVAPWRGKQMLRVRLFILFQVSHFFVARAGAGAQRADECMLFF